MARIYVLHENTAWVEPLRAAFAETGLPVTEWFLNETTLPFDQEAPQGVFYNRMSASSHTRGHRYAPELTLATLNWLERDGRRVVNGSRALQLEVSKLAQYSALQRNGLRTPRTAAAVGREQVLAVVDGFGPGPYILKPNRGGKGLGVQLFQTRQAIADYLEGPGSGEEAPIDGIWLVQEYIKATAPFITRAEFVGGRFHYAVRVDTSDGFELCPADVCNVENAFCPAEQSQQNKFTLAGDFTETAKGRALVLAYEAFLRDSEVEVAGIEFIEDPAGEIFTYDINTNTNYNAQAETEAGLRVTGMQALAAFLGSELTTRYPQRPQIVAAE